MLNFQLYSSVAARTGFFVNFAIVPQPLLEWEWRGGTPGLPQDYHGLIRGRIYPPLTAKMDTDEGGSQELWGFDSSGLAERKRCGELLAEVLIGTELQFLSSMLDRRQLEALLSAPRDSVVPSDTPQRHYLSSPGSWSFWPLILHADDADPAELERIAAAIPPLDRTAIREARARNEGRQLLSVPTEEQLDAKDRQQEQLKQEMLAWAKARSRARIDRGPDIH